jgi:adenosylcobinamide kinase/adenosylcobinamide-phosphate guanylyltransferase
VITLILGGSGSGKSRAAEELTGTLPPPVTYVATWVPSAEDPDMRARVETHRARRPPDWASLEVAGDLGGALRSIAGSVLVDALGTWVASAPDFAVDADDLCAALRDRAGDTVVVSDEVGLGVHPPTGAGRRFRDALGAVNQAVAASADEVWLVVAGRVLPLAVPRWAGR